MNPDDTVDLSIRDRRPNRLISPLLLCGLGGFWVALAGLCAVGVLDRLPGRVEALIPAFGIVSCGVLAIVITRQSVPHWKLGDKLVVWRGREYRPADIREIAFAPDPSEDFDDAATPAPLCEVRARLRRGELRLIASVGGARRLRNWAAEKGIAVSDPAGVLGGRRSGERMDPLDE